MLATPLWVSRAASLDIPCRCAVPGHQTTCSDYTRGQSRETGSLSRLFCSVETTAKCVSVGPAQCRERIQNPVRLSSASIQRGESHSGGSRAGSGNGMRSRYSLKEGGHRGGSSSRERVWVLQPVLHSSKEGWRVASHFRSASVEPLSQQTEVQDADTQTGRVSDQVRGLVCHDRSKRRILPCLHPSHSQEVPEVCFRGEAYQYRVLPFGLALSPHTFTKCVDAVLAPLRLRGIRILNYIDDWLILAQSEWMAAQHRDVVLAHMKVLGLRLNAKKSVLSPLQRTTYLGVVWDSTTMQARMSPARIESILKAVRRVKEGQSLTVKQFQRLLGLKAAASNVITIGLLYMRPLQWWLKTKGFSLRRNTLRMIKVTRRCLHALDMWKKPWFLPQGPVLGAPCRRETLMTDASLMGWGAVMSGHSAQGLWEGPHLSWHINCLEMLAVFQALKHFLPDLRGHHVLVRTDNTSVVSYINRQGGLRSRPLYRLAHQILLWSQGKLLSLRAVYIPGYLNQGADILTRQGAEAWGMDAPHRGDGADLEEVRSSPGGLVCVSRDLTMSPLALSDSSSSTGAGCHGTEVAEASSVHLPPDCSAPGSSGESSPGRGSSFVSSPVLARPSMVCGPGSPARRLSMGDSHLAGSPLTGRGHHFSPPPRVVEAVGVDPEGAQLIASGLSTEVVETILQSRAPSTRKLYTAKWQLFTYWCHSRQLDPVVCPIGSVLEFLQDRFASGLSSSTLNVYMAAIAAHHAPVGEQSLGRNPLVTRFLQGNRRLRPPVRPRMPTWDLAVVLEALSKAPFEPLEEVPLRFLTVKTVFLLTIFFLKRVGDLQALSVAPSCLEFAPGMARAFLYPRPGYVPKVPSVVPQPVILQAFCPTPFRDSDQEKLNCVHTSTELPCGESQTNCLCATVLIRRVFLLTSRPSAGG